MDKAQIISKYLFEKFLIIVLPVILIGFYFWIGFMSFILKSEPEKGVLRARLGTILWHSSDKDGVYEAAYLDDHAVDHTYCYYPKNTAKSNLILIRQDDGDCSDYMGEAIIRESPWVSEQEKIW